MRAPHPRRARSGRTRSDRPPPGGPTRARGEYASSRRTRRRILDAAVEVACVAGVRGAAMARIAERAGVAVGNVYYHFASREMLMRAVQAELFAHMRDEVLEAALPRAGFFAREEAGFRAYLRFSRRNPGYVRIVEELRFHFPEDYDAGIRFWMRALRRALREGVASGELAPLDERALDTLAHFLLGSRTYLDRKLEAGSEHDDNALVATYLGLLRSGLRRRDD